MFRFTVIWQAIVFCLTFAYSSTIDTGKSGVVQEQFVSSKMDSASAHADQSKSAVHDSVRSAGRGVYVLGRTVVNGSRKQRLLETSQSLSVIKPEEWRGTNKSLADVIAEQTGVQTRRYGGAGSYQTVSIRGVQGSEVLVLLDGIPLNSATGGAVDIGAIDPDRIGEIEVYKGITPGRFGGNAIGGVVNLKSKADLSGKSAEINASMGSYGYLKTNIGINHRLSDKGNIFGAVNYTRCDNDFPYLDRNSAPYNHGDYKFKRVQNHEMSAIDAQIQTSFNLHSGHSLVTALSYSNSDQGIPAEEGKINKTANYRQEIISFSARLNEMESNEFPYVHFNPEIGIMQWSDKNFWTSLDQSTGTPYGGATSTVPNSFDETDSKLRVAHCNLAVDMGLNEFLGSDVTLEGNYSDIVSTATGTGVEQSDWPGNSQQLTVSADLNGVIPLFSALNLGATIGGSSRATRNKITGGENELLDKTVDPSNTIDYSWACHGGIHLGFDRTFNAFANIARYSSVPGLRERFGSRGAILPNPSLKEETGISLETGIRILFERLFLETVLFRTEMKDEIIMVPYRNLVRPENIAEALCYGIEFTAWIHPISFLQLETRNTLQQPENRSRMNKYYGKLLPDQPQLSFIDKCTIGSFHGVEFSYWMDYKSFFFHDYGNLQRVPEEAGKFGVGFHNAQLTWKASSRLRLDLSIRNFSGTSLRYEDMSRSNESGYSRILYPANEWTFTVGYSF